MQLEAYGDVCARKLGRRRLRASLWAEDSCASISISSCCAAGAGAIWLQVLHNNLNMLTHVAMLAFVAGCIHNLELYRDKTVQPLCDQPMG